MTVRIKYYLKVAFVLFVILGLVMSYVWNPRTPVRQPTTETTPTGIELQGGEPDIFTGPTSEPSVQGPTTPPSQKGPTAPPPQN